MPRNRICIIGSGATAIYTLKHLLAAPQRLDITIFEQSSEVGKGMPYRSDMNADYMLCNAFSREIPKITRTLIDWLECLPKHEMTEWELSTHDLSARAFYPRLLIGKFLADEFIELANEFQRAGHKISTLSKVRVNDLVLTGNGCVSVRFDSHIEPHQSIELEFDHTIIATGHYWPVAPKIDEADIVSPWPYTNVTGLSPGHIGILGSSLSAIDVVVALGSTHGRFVELNGHVSWQPDNHSSGFRITMVSKMGIMPEGDFYYRYPYVPLEVFSKQAVELEVSRGSEALLQRLFVLLSKELDVADPEYLNSLGPTARTIEGFSIAYFEQRQKLGARETIKADFLKARKSIKDRETIVHRYVLLRAHENFDVALRTLNEEDFALFEKTLLPVFADSYAAVPHLSLARVIALFDAGVLSLTASGEDAKFVNSDSGGVGVLVENEQLNFDAMIDARGQAKAGLDELPFSSLVKDLVDREKPLTSPFKLELGNESSIYCLALPQILERYPFSQGLANVEENGGAVASHILSRMVL